MSIEDNLTHRFPIDVNAIIPYGPEKPANWNIWGPDIVLLHIPSTHVGSINARKTFYSPTIDGKTTVGVSHIEVWVLMGAPHALGKFTLTHADIEIRGFFVKKDKPLETRGEFDYFQVEDVLTLTSIQSFGGVSGEGLWKVLIYGSGQEQINWVRSLEGVAFYEQLYSKDNLAEIRCHGPKSILKCRLIYSRRVQRMNWVRDFGANEGHNPPVRNVEDAPQPTRQELVDLIFGLSEQTPPRFRTGCYTGLSDRASGLERQGNPTAVSAMPLDAT